MDPLSVLRDYAIRNDLDSIVRVNDDFRFGSDYSFPAAAPTAYRSKQGHLFTLETLIHFLKHSHLKYTDYMKNIKPLAVPTVSFIDRKPLLDYLLGHVSSSDAVQYVNPNFSPAPAAEYRPEDPGLDPRFDPELDANEDVSRVGLSENYIEMIRAAERPVRDREAILECKNKDFYEVLKAAARREEERQRSDSQQRKDGLVAKNRLMRGDERGFGEELGLGYDSTPRAKMGVKGGKAGEGVPIILVPSALQTLITIYNVKEFLEDGVFIPTDAKMKQVKVAKPDCVTVQKKFSRDRVVTAYEVRDKPSALKAEDWDRVVAVFVLGKEWQFKDWPFKDHVEIFNKILGFYMRFEDDSVESAKIVKQWNVKIISISKNKRHQDRAAALEVWDKLEEFMRSRSHG
ncbi:hypothetical protein RHMOL_Rhmol03G0177200 [Rhododendron molle]|uniref:Uncharacterized protein n=5 Tax=Rhododendron molle TaxID=49168 RepID=A0ACC0PFV6_RHOML|nr:hypothetical protein RHMOL_Rhmol03G0177200 [Rhododendron molle]KAI8564384.1 hypothetical protein RHMOL_Rhmol03G0177200 [Rhododendron molle]KAI8564385.1 hypothetical protein RHMOL_Rhmol03G0177200 [Rhododendron molle]KAI8564386.1 hypothetical protein RHMOL_Rhmol03G0177200 [Rhododendron molle]KAI8564387.1 hypothetical protein RHMOL_Rhmol03G0177200 [Rhododendron molle]